jgi:hypothetical protein
MKPRHWFLFLFPLLSVCSHGPKLGGYTLKIFQYEGTDSLKKELAVTKVFNAQNQIISEQYHRNYEETDGGATYCCAPGFRQFIYRDTFLIKTLSASRGDSTKGYFLHNAKGKLIKSRFFRYEKQLKPDVDKGLGRPGGCIVLPEDYEKNRVWHETGGNANRYNAAGKLIEEISFSRSKVLETHRWSYSKSGKLLEQSSFVDNETTPSSRTHYFYDEHGRVSKRVSYYNEELSATDNYSYRNNAVYQDGTYAAFPGENPPSIYRNVKKMDSKGRLVEEVAYVGRCPLETRKRIRYCPDGRIAQTILFTCRDSSRLVHDYVYNFR